MCIYVQSHCHLCPKNGLNLAKRLFYTSVIQDHWDKGDNGVMYTSKEIESGLKLVRMEADIATHTCKLLLRKKPEHWDINIVLL